MVFVDGEGKGRKAMEGKGVEAAVYIKFQKGNISKKKKEKGN